ncbi:CubicO group peptidase (beta-lactamase class C family) [Actinoplanes tereljensis]|uniref:Serine hydrolase n=1 Tax=Paractinoplanes tereljensis TaxID=571912 RepID=A0A919NKH5_9ACTN|nr:serine hydrolase domain-containing protein [Actinoplanes tereljensis]GIF20431.1 serine hydrolase [Actinoplanes tereljensis]
MDLQGLLDGAAKRHGVPGAAVAVGAGGELFEAATGVVNRDTGVDATPDSVFQIGSVTKVWTASLVMQLVADGLVELDVPVRHYLPSFGVVDETATATVTVRQLLSHTGGFEGDLFEDTGRGDDAVAKLIAWMHTNAPQVHPPGAMHSYANSGFVVLGAMVAALRGGTWESVARERLVEPLGVTHMALHLDEGLWFRAAVGHVGEERQVSRIGLPRSNAPAGSIPAAAPRELVRFGRMFLADGVAADGTRVLPAGTFATMLEPQVTVPAMGERYVARWGLGFELFDHDGVLVVGHDGGTIGQSTCWRIVPSRDVVVAINANGGDATPLIDEVLAAVLADTAGIRLPDRLRPPAEPVPFDPAPYVGSFEGPLARYDVAAADGGLDITWIPKGLAAEAGEKPKTVRNLAVGGDRFVAVETDEGVHPTAMFLEGGRYLYGGGRAIPRV